MSGDFFRSGLALRAAIVLLALGGLGGSLQPSRLVLVVVGIPALLLLVAGARLGAAPRLPAVFMALAMLLFGTLSLAWSPALEDGLRLLLVVFIGLLSVPLACLCDRKLSVARDVRDAWSWALALTLPFAMYELATGQHFAYALDDRDLGGEVGEVPFASVFFGNYNNYCAFVSLTLPMLFGSLEEARRRLPRWFWSGCALLAFVVLVVNTNRLSMIFAGCLVAYYALSRPSWRLPLIWVSGAAAVLVLAGFMDQEIESILVLAELKFTALGGGDESLDQRTGLIAAGLADVWRSLGMGTGVGSFEHNLARHHPDLIPNAHNLMVELATNFGLIPTIMFVGFLFRLFQLAWTSDLPRDLRSVVLLGVPFVPALGAINSQAIGYTYWWLWLASMVVICAVDHRQLGPSGARRATGKHRRIAPTVLTMDLAATDSRRYLREP